MKKIKYKILPPVGSYEPEVEGTLVDLIQDLPYLLVWNVIPPLGVINEILISGIYDKGMSGGCEWTPFKITQSEYESLVDELLKLPNKKLYVDNQYSYLNNSKEWFCVVYKSKSENINTDTDRKT